MNTKLLFYKKFEGKVTSPDYVNWAIHMLEKNMSTPSLTILASLNEPLNIFEVESYYSRAKKELQLQEPTKEECVLYYIYVLLRKIVYSDEDVLDVAYDVYKVVREHVIHEDFLTIDEVDEFFIWYDISEKIDDFRYGDNLTIFTRNYLTTLIVMEANKQLQNHLFDGIED
ncbi:hypothetical protein [Bacillus massiliigorillae]|uniref:hypothetical protein n=1 Tax=Bacillus massiliigorillae TaxID=1243664 RepID=UPI00039EA1D3|nr:hypothetical protein [Bacillus massiliigorillae]